MPGPTLGRYRLSERLAEGESWELWRGDDVGLGGLARPVAVERLAPSLTSDRALALEVSRAFVVSHPNLVAVRDAGELDGRLFVAWEWVDGATLQRLIERLQAAHRPFPLRFACLVTIDAARGLDEAHRARDAAGKPSDGGVGLVHGDVGPERLWISLAGEVKLAGLGLGRARLIDGSRGTLAPEQARGEPAIDGRADVFALGALLYELASGQNPFGAPHEDAAERLGRLRVGACPSLRTLQPALPQGLEAIVARAMAPSPDDRYPSCGQLREDLEALARREGYALAQADFALFVRELMATPAEAAAPAKRLSGSRAVATPRAFNAALGGALALLDGGDDADEANGGAPRINGDAAGAATAGPTTAPPPRTLAMPKLHAAIAPPTPAIEPPRASPNSDMTELIPRDGGFGALWMSLGAVALTLVGGVALLVLRPFRSNDAWSQRAPVAAQPPVARKPSAPVAAPPSASAPQSAAPTPQSAAPAPPPPQVVEREHHARAARPAGAHLTITADVAADAFVDGNYVRPTPIVDLELPPGRHVVRVESTAPGLRLIPRQETVELHPGELRELQMVLQ